MSKKSTIRARENAVERAVRLVCGPTSFGTTSDELLNLHDWLSTHRVSHVAMEATGVYWKPVFYVLEPGFTLLLVNPADVQRMPERKTDVSDSAWRAQLLEHGLLRPSFIPPRAIRELRDRVRYRRELKHDHTRVANRLHKVLQDADLKLSSVMSDILGVSGRLILRQLAAGHSDPAALAELARGSVRAKQPALRQAPSGRFSPHHAFLISQALTELDNLEESMSALAARVEQHLAPFAQQIEQLSTIPGIERLAATVILSEIGTDMSCFGRIPSSMADFGRVGKWLSASKIGMFCGANSRLLVCGLLQQSLSKELRHEATQCGPTEDCPPVNPSTRLNLDWARTYCNRSLARRSKSDFECAQNDPYAFVAATASERILDGNYSVRRERTNRRIAQHKEPGRADDVPLPSPHSPHLEG